MRKSDIQELKLMEEIDRADGATTQRELANKLNISLGLVNSFVKRIVRKGYFKVTTIPGRRVQYILTPKGISEKSQKTLSYVQYSLTYYKDVRSKLQELALDLMTKGVRRVALVGVGELAELFYLTMKQNDIEIVSVSSLASSGEFFLGYQVGPLDELSDFSEYVCVMELEKIDECIERLRELGVPDDRIVLSSNL
ncbi:MAG: winged helix-turn-helix transcriptional regulator [Nitrospinaceae bacterium]|nr:winged helix-turn-helix transcriptional regulator [Nitrospinaceae bacterium]MBT3822372.1 winged helix-turn-helix transcriptional regulator [Nitrospinaceae bacterium]MBT4430712.1 winged helix-turn-helix transcriptional regulator [Nitrospinaceae bacterium]MBT5369782.1 winged helix-turn-helix transcriptional regulator [Nitrospinaceae bacterium]MBT6394922.1 winged helix-turn-helix transcriptional regulator [Nitrospinaceae bacterium]